MDGTVFEFSQCQLQGGCIKKVPVIVFGDGLSVHFHQDAAPFESRLRGRSLGIHVLDYGKIIAGI